MLPTDIFERQPIAAYRLLRFLPIDSPVSHLQDPILDSLFDPSFLPSFSRNDLKRDVIVALHRAESGSPLPPSTTDALEKLATNDLALWPLAARANVLSSDNRVAESRRRLSVQGAPFVMPGNLHSLQVEALAAGDQVFSALHIEWMRKLADLTLESLTLDCRCQGFWFGPLIDVLPEKALSKALRKLLRRRRMPEGSWGMAAIYAHLLNLRAEQWVDRGGQFDKAFYEYGCQLLAR